MTAMEDWLHNLPKPNEIKSPDHIEVGGGHDPNKPLKEVPITPIEPIGLTDKEKKSVIRRWMLDKDFRRVLQDKTPYYSTLDMIKWTSIYSAIAGLLGFISKGCL